MVDLVNANFEKIERKKQIFFFCLNDGPQVHNCFYFFYHRLNIT